MKLTFLFTSIFVVLNVLLVTHLPISAIVPALGAIIALNAMAVCLILSAHFYLLEKLLGGPDQCYVLHRYFGYLSVSAMLIHWVSADDALTAIFPAISNVANESGELAASAILLLIIISALKIIPYHLWKKSHLLMGPFFLISVFHSFFSNSPIAFNSMTWWIMLTISLLACIAWLKTLNAHFKQPVSGKVIAIHQHNDTLDIRVAVSQTISATAGQYANISIDKSNLQEQHPFSIASNTQDNQLRFIIKNNGDYTHQLQRTLKLHDTVNIHSVAGHFTPQFKESRNRQIWIAAGSGISPFLAALDNMQSDAASPIELVVVKKSISPEILHELTLYQQKLASFTLHVIEPNERLSMQHFNALHTHWRQADLYLCGPDTLKQAARQIWQQSNAKGRIYTEAFDYRAAFSTQQLLMFFSKVINYTYFLLIQRLFTKAHLAYFSRFKSNVMMKKVAAMITIGLASLKRVYDLPKDQQQKYNFNTLLSFAHRK